MSLLEELRALRPFEPDEVLEITGEKLEAVIAELERHEAGRTEEAKEARIMSELTKDRVAGRSQKQPLEEFTITVTLKLWERASDAEEAVNQAINRLDFDQFQREFIVGIETRR